jgi:hypothetical protein
MYEQRIISKPSFSLCFTRADDAEKSGTIAGALTMGGTDKRLHTQPMVYAYGFPTKGVMHGVNIRKIYIMEAGQYEVQDVSDQNTRLVDISTSYLNSGSVIVDSGTTDTYMTRALSRPFMNAFKQVTGYDYIENGMHLTDEQVNQLPTIIIQLQGHESHNQDVMKNHQQQHQDKNKSIPPGLAGAVDKENPYDILISIPPAHYIEYDSSNKKYVGR